MNTPIVKDSGQRQEFQTGSRRDTNAGKPCPDLISPFLRLRVGTHLALGALKYSRGNWAKGQPSSRYREALERHMMLADMGLTDEDHLSAAVFNLMGIIHNQEMKRLGWLPEALDDWPVDWRAQCNGGDPKQTGGGNANKEEVARFAAAAQEYVSALYALMAAKAAEGLAPEQPAYPTSNMETP